MIIKPNANEESSYYVLATFYDEDDSLVVPDTLSWTLMDASGNVVNSREDVVVSSLNSTVVISLSGDDLAVDGYFSNRRVMLFTGTYTTTISGSSVSLPTSQSVMFDIDRILSPVQTDNNLIAMIDRLSVYFNDPKLDIVVPNIRVSLLNEAQTKVVPRLNRNTLHALDIVLPGQTLEDPVITGGEYSYDLSQLVNPVYNGNTCIDGILVSGSSRYAHLVSYDEFQKRKNTGYVYPAERPVYYQKGTRVFLSPWTAGDTIDISYKKQPAIMSLHATDESLSIPSDFDSSIRDILIEYAAYSGLRFIIKDERRAAVAFDMVQNDIVGLNNLHPQTDSNTIQDPYGYGPYDDCYRYPITVEQYIP